MKTRWLTAPALLAISTLFVSCASTPTVTDTRPRFREAGTADIVIRQYRGQRINLTQPEYRENGFFVQLSPQELGTTFSRLHIKRDFAVVVLEWTHGQEDVNQIVADWKSRLHSEGFRRVVCLQADDPVKVNGLPILDDTQPSDTPIRTASL